MAHSENYTELDEKNLRVTLDSVIDVSLMSQEEEIDNNTLINDVRSNNEAILSFDIKTLYRSAEFQDKRKKFEIEIMDLLGLTDSDDIMFTPADLAFEKFYSQYGIAATETLNGLIVKNLHKKNVLKDLLRILSNIDYEKIYSFGSSLLIGIIGIYKDNEDVEITDLIIKCIENWNTNELIDILQNIESKTGFLRVYKRKVLSRLES
ncbi:hypothetical protein [Pedobacter sp. UC225_65]|uniref:hypothetical protein n=1 Tax=Pedobacter sp. UC225_65 TaxID=3350173 RepID=UPI00366FB434